MSCVRVPVPPARALPIARTSDAAPSLSSLLSLPKFRKILISPVCIVRTPRGLASVPTSSVASVVVTNAPQIGSGGIARRSEEWGGGGGVGRFDSVAANRIACWDRMPETEGRVQMRQAREDMTSRGTHTRCCAFL